MISVRNMGEYRVKVIRANDKKAVADSHGFSLEFSVKTGDSSNGFNATEALLSAFGTCLMTNINSLAGKMRININKMEIEVIGKRIDSPPSIAEIFFNIEIDCDAKKTRIEKLIDLSLQYGTVTNTLLSGTNIKIGKIKTGR